MNWFKETWWIVKQLFTKVKADKVEYKHMDHYPFSGYSAMKWIKGNPIIYPASSAYYTIPYEMEAYANDDNFDYLKTRKPEDLDKYKIKDRKKTYKANKKNWRQYLKTIK